MANMEHNQFPIQSWPGSERDKQTRQSTIEMKNEKNIKSNQMVNEEKLLI